MKMMMIFKSKKIGDYLKYQLKIKIMCKNVRIYKLFNISINKYHHNIIPFKKER